MGRKRPLLIGLIVLGVTPLVLVSVLGRDDPTEPVSPEGSDTGVPGSLSAKELASALSTNKLASRALLRPAEAPPIVYPRLQGNSYQLYGSTPDGGEAERITDRLAYFPVWSPDGGRLAFVTKVLGSTTPLGIAVIEPSGAIKEILRGPQVPSHPSFDPSHNRILYQSKVEDQTSTAGAGRAPVIVDAVGGGGVGGAINAVGERGGHQRTLIDERGASYHPAASPSGASVAAVLGRAGCDKKLCPQSLVLFEGALDEPRTLIGSGVAASPAWSPDGSRLAFTWDQGRGPGVWTIDVASGDLSQVTTGFPPDAEPTWSPDGTRIAFSRDCDIFVVSVGGGDARNITGTRTCEISPSWRPRG